MTCTIRVRNCLPFARPCVYPRVLKVSLLLHILVFCVVLCVCVLLVFALCPVCTVLPVSLDCPFLIALRLSIMFIEHIKLICHNMF